MEITKIRPKYCAKDKVQIMFSNAYPQVICSKDGYLYFRDSTKTIHKYLDDPLKESMPYYNEPSSDYHATHLLKYNHIYLKSTTNRNMVSNPRNNGSILTFLYCAKLNKGAVVAEAFLEDFVKEDEEQTIIMTKDELEKFLYDTSNIDLKCILDPFEIVYLKYKDDTSLLKKSFIDLSDSGIIDTYNQFKRGYFIGYSYPSPGLHFKDISEVKPFKIIPRPSITGNRPKPLIISISNDIITVRRCTIEYVATNQFKVTYNETIISADKLHEMLSKSFKGVLFAAEPHFLRAKKTQ